MGRLLGLLHVVESQLPHSPEELYLAEIVSMGAFGTISLMMGLIYTKRVDLYRILRNGIGGGAAFPASVLLIFYPVSPSIRALFGTDFLKGYVMVAGGIGVVLSLYGLLKP